MTKRVLVVEPLATGHRPAYLLNSLEALHSAGFSVGWLTTDECANELRQRVAGVEVSATLSASALQSALDAPNLVREWQIWWMLRRAWQRLRDDYDSVFLPYLDYCPYISGIIGHPFRGAYLSGIAIRPYFHLSSMGVVVPAGRLDPLRGRIYRRFISSLAATFAIDPLFAEWLSKHGLQSKYLADPVNYFSEGKASTPAPQNLVVLVYGVIDARKGVEDLIDAASLRPMGLEIRLVGRADPAYLEELLTRARQVGVKVAAINEYVTAEVEANQFGQASLVWLGYRSHFGMSGVQLLAAAARKPVLACPEGLIGFNTRKFGLGQVFASRSPAAIRTALDAAIECGLSSAIDRERFLAGRDYESFRRTIAEVFE